MASLRWRVLVLAVSLLCLHARNADAQITITSGEYVNFRFGFLGQFQGQTVSLPETGGNASDIFIRRIRLMMDGQITKQVTFFFDTDAPNLGKTLNGVKNLPGTMIVQDAFVTFRALSAFSLDAGLMFVPTSRNSLGAAATLLPIDYGPYTFTSSGPTQSSTGRDTGVQARGYLFSNKLEYRGGTFQGMRNATSSNTMRWAGRAQYNVFETETGFFYPGTYLGKGKRLAVGTGFDVQSHYHSYAADVFVDMPLGPGGLTAQFDYTFLDGESTLPSIARQNNYMVEAGYLIRSLKLMPVFQFSQRDFQTGADQRQWSIGANWYWENHNANVKAAYSRIETKGATGQHQFVIQFQVFYF